MPQKLGKAIAYGVLIWVIGFAWGSVVFMTALKNIPPIPYVSRYPAISFPLLVAWILLGYLLARGYLKTVDDKANEGLRLGFVFAVVNLLLDLLVIVWLFRNGLGYFPSFTVWLAYFLLLIVPWLTGRFLASAGREGSGNR
jgi:hypothetical protein